jgi:plasmid maintenance system antidote protein VapI
MIEVTPEYLNRLIKSKRGISEDIISKICKALKIKPAEFYIEADTPIIANEKEKQLLEKYREAEELNVQDKISMIAQWTIDNARNEKQKSDSDKTKRKPKRTAKTHVNNVTMKATVCKVISER